jgi:hypothetical protein
MENNRNSKTFNFSDISDYVFYLSELIIDTIQKKERIEFYLKEIENIIETNPKAKLINSDLYEAISDKTMRPIQYIFNLLGDESKKAVSYRKFRKLLFNNKMKLGIQLDKLNLDEENILGQFNQLRNWGLHIPESLFIQKKVFFKMDKDFIIENKKKIIIPKYNNFEIEFLHKFKVEIQEVITAIELILTRMKSDYEALIGETFELEYEDNFAKPYLIMNIAQDSWDVQNGRQVNQRTK